MQSIVYFAGIRARSPEENKLNKIRKLFDAAGLGNAIRKGDLTAIKIHFGESGNDSFINPVLVRPSGVHRGSWSQAISHGHQYALRGL
jgi:uncharacterized Fe-S center protein